MINLIEFVPHGILRQSGRLKEWVLGVESEFNLMLDRFEFYRVNFNPWSISDEDFVDQRLKELGYSCINFNAWTFLQKKNFVVFKWGEQGSLTRVDIEKALLAHHFSVTITEFSKSIFRAGTRCNRPVWGESSRFIFDVAYSVAGDKQAIECLIKLYKPKHTHFTMTLI